MADSNSFTSHFIELRSRLIKSIIFIFVIFVVSTVLYPIVIKLFLPEMAVFVHYNVFWMLLFGVSLFSGIVSVFGILMYTGNIRAHLYRAFFTLFINLIGNVVLIPIIGRLILSIAFFNSFASTSYGN